jgi:hypothetical protein
MFCTLIFTPLLCAQQHGGPPTAQSSTQANKQLLAKQVREEFLHAWNGYKKYAWGHDDLRPLSKTYHDWYGQSLLMTPVDALDTMILMGLDDEARSTREYIAETLSFDKDIEVQNFESASGKSATLDAVWTLRRAKDGRSETRRTTVHEKPQDNSYDALAAAHSRAVARLSQDIADAVRVLSTAQ